MKNSLEKIQKRLKGDALFNLIIMLVFFCLSGQAVAEAICYGVKAVDTYEIKLLEQEGVRYYAIVVNGEEKGNIDYNEFCNYDTEELPKFAKVKCVSNNVQRAVSCAFIGAIVLCINMIFVEIKKGNTPFQRKSVIMLRIAGILMMCGGIISYASRFMTELFVMESIYSYDRISPTAIFVVVMGGVMLLISEIFQYGCDLQEDSDSIA